jgi:hypothetical protein
MGLPCCCGRSINVRRAAVASSIALCIYLVLAIIILPAIMVPRYRLVPVGQSGRANQLRLALT